MVMRGDLDLAGVQLLYRMIAAVVSELQLESFSTQRDSGELVSETNSKDRLTPHQAPDVVDCVGARLGISRTVRQKHAGGLERQHIFRLSLGRNHRDLAAF